MIEINVPVKLINGPTYNQGRVEVYYSGLWGSVCDDIWDNDNADVVCRQLGYPEWGNHLAVTKAYFGSGSGPIWMDNVQCTGAESNVGRCPHYGWGKHDCGHSEDAGVICDTGI